MSETRDKVFFRLPDDTPLSEGPAGDSSFRPALSDLYTLSSSGEQTSPGWFVIEPKSDSKYPARPLFLQLPPDDYELIVYAQKRLEEAERLCRRDSSASIRVSLTAASAPIGIIERIKRRTNNPALEAIIYAIEKREADLFI